MPVLECTNLSKSYGPKRALESVNLALEPGRIVGLLGPNGSGKSTLIKLTCGLLTPTAGAIRVCGGAPGPASCAQVSYLPERMAVPGWMSVKELLDFYQDFYADFRRDAAEQMLADLHLELLLLELQRRQETLELLLRVLLLFQLGFGELDLSHAASPSVQFFFGQY